MSLTNGGNTSITTFVSVTFDDTPQVALAAHTTAAYFVFANKTGKQVNISVGGTGAEFILDDNDFIDLQGDPSRYHVYNATDSASVSVVYAVHSYL